MTTSVNQGTDPRIEGPIGEYLARTQRALSFRSEQEPKTASLPIGDGRIAVSWPPFFSVFIPRKNGNYFSFRIGWRHDPNWGDGNNPNEMKVDHPGGYIADVILKPNIDNVVKQ